MLSSIEKRKRQTIKTCLTVITIFLLFLTVNYEVKEEDSNASPQKHERRISTLFEVDRNLERKRLQFMAKKNKHFEDYLELGKICFQLQNYNESNDNFEKAMEKFEGNDCYES